MIYFRKTYNLFNEIIKMIIFLNSGYLSFAIYLFLHTFTLKFEINKLWQLKSNF